MARPLRSQLRADEIAVVDVGMGGIVATIPVGREPYGVTSARTVNYCTLQTK